MYLDRIRVLYQDAFGPASSYSINEVLMIISTVVEGHHGIKVCWTGSLSLQFLKRHGCAICTMHNSILDSLATISLLEMSQPTSDTGAFWSCPDPSTRKQG